MHTSPGEGYIAYSGPLHADEGKGTLTHSMFLSLFPNWLGRTQPRVVHMEDDMLYLRTAAPIFAGGGGQEAHVVPWPHKRQALQQRLLTAVCALPPFYGSRAPLGSGRAI